MATEPFDAWSVVPERNPLEDLKELTKQAVEYSKNARPPRGITPSEVGVIQSLALALGQEATKVKDGKFLGMVVVKA